MILVLSIGQGLNGFTYDSLVGEFILTHPDIQVGSHQSFGVTTSTCYLRASKVACLNLPSPFCMGDLVSNVFRFPLDTSYPMDLKGLMAEICCIMINGFHRLISTEGHKLS